MITTYRRTDLIEEAVSAAAARHELDRGTIEADLASVIAELASIDAKIDRYLTAFENE